MRRSAWEGEVHEIIRCVCCVRTCRPNCYGVILYLVTDLTPSEGVCVFRYHHMTEVVNSKGGSWDEVIQEVDIVK